LFSRLKWATKGLCGLIKACFFFKIKQFIDLLLVEPRVVQSEGIVHCKEGRGKIHDSSAVRNMVFEEDEFSGREGAASSV
jgi:hypothetical protein